MSVFVGLGGVFRGPHGIALHGALEAGGPWLQTAGNLTTAPEGKTHRKKLRMICFLQGLGQSVGRSMKYPRKTREIATNITDQPVVDTLQRGVRWMGGAVDWGSIM